MSKTDFTFTHEKGRRERGKERGGGILGGENSDRTDFPASLAIMSIDLGTAAASRAAFRRTHGLVRRPADPELSKLI